MNIAYHELMNDSRLMIDPNKDVNEVCALVLAGTRNGCVILGGGSPKNFYLQAQPTLWEVYGIPKGGNEFFIQITTDQVVWGGLSGATPAEAVSWGKVNPGVLPDTVVAYVDSTIAFPIFADYAVGSTNNRRARKDLVHRRAELVADLKRQAKEAAQVAARRERFRDNRRHRPRPLTRTTVGTLPRSSPPTRGCPMPRIYADANVPAGVVSFMRHDLGWDVLFVIEHDDLRRAPDTRHYELARQLSARSSRSIATTSTIAAFRRMSSGLIVALGAQRGTAPRTLLGGSIAGSSAPARTCRTEAAARRPQAASPIRPG